MEPSVLILEKTNRAAEGSAGADLHPGELLSSLIQSRLPVWAGSDDE